MIYLVIGLLIGFFVALPVGAVAVLCINRTLQYGIKSGFYTGIGVAAADFFYGTLAVFGLVAVSGENLQNQPVLRLVGGLCIMFIGAQMMAKKIDKIKLVDLHRHDNFKNAVTGALLTISNPVTVLAFISVLSYLNFLNIFDVVILRLLNCCKEVGRFNFLKKFITLAVSILGQ